MRTVLLLWVVATTWNRVLGINPIESFQASKTGYHSSLNEIANLDLLHNGLEREFVYEIGQLNKSDKNDTSQCIDQLKDIFTSTESGQSTQALRFLDSWGKFPSGILWGHLMELGNFDECLSIEDTNPFGDGNDYIRGQYCMANIPFGAFFTNVSDDLKPFAKIKVGICIPRSCNAFYINELFNQILFRIFNVTLTSDIVTEDKCIKDNSLAFDTIDWIATAIFSLTGALVIGSTIYHLISIKRGDMPNQMFSAFSLSVNIKHLFRTSSRKSTNIISCLNGIRCMSIVWIIFGHSYMISIFLPNINTVEIFKWTQTPFSMLLQSATISVDSFFFLSGLLLVWASLKEMEKTGGKLNVLVMYLHRYIRLTPVLAAAMLFYVSLYRHMGEGPLWKGFTSTHELCHETWWATLLYIQNYAAAGKMCVGHTWYLAVDMQLYVLSPLILIPIFRWKKKAVAMLIVLGFLLVSCVFTTIVINNFSVFRTIGNLGTDTQEMRQIYYATHARTSPWLVGIIFGYFLYNHRNSRITMSRVVVLCGWLVSLGILAAVIFALYPKTLPGAEPLTALEGAFYLTLSRLGWPLALSWIVFACVNGYGGFANSFLSWKFWQPMARLSYCMYINHLIIETIHGGRTKVNVHFSDYDTILRFWGDFGITLLASVITYLMFESPIIGIEKVLFDTNQKKSVTNATVSNQNLCDNEA